LKIVAGTAKGKQLLAPAGNDLTRPTSEKVREAIFGSIQFEITGSTVLDLFAGSGAWGIEALSRGAEHAVFVDKGREAVGLVRANLRSTGLAAKGEVVAADFRKAMSRLAGRQFDFIFADPPYAAGLYEEVIAGVREYGLLREDGMLILEHDNTQDFSRREDLAVRKVKRYGRTFVTYIDGEQR